MAVGRLLILDWIPPRDDLIDGYAFIFDGGTLDRAAITTIRLPPRELEDFAFVDPVASSARLAPGLARRLAVSLDNRDIGKFTYLNNGRVA